MEIHSSTGRPLLARIFLSSSESRLRAGWRLLLHFVLLALIAIFINIPILFFLTLIGQQDLYKNLLIGSIGVELSILISVSLARRLLDRRSFTSLGLSWNRFALRDLLFGITLAGLIMGIIFLGEAAVGWLTVEGFAWQEIPLPAVLQGFASMLAAFIFVGIAEELLSRGYWLQNLADGLNLAWGVSISSCLFALMHLANPNISWVAILGLVMAGFFLAYGYLRTRQLWLSIGLHIGWNLFEGTVFGFAVSGTESFRLIRQSVAGPELVTGGAFGPEAGLVILPALLLGAVIIYLYTHSRTPVDEQP